MTFDLTSFGKSEICDGSSLVDVMCGMAFIHACTTSYIWRIGGEGGREGGREGGGRGEGSEGGKEGRREGGRAGKGEG